MSADATTDWPMHLAACARRACLLEATARKPGNVHPEASYPDLCYDDFVRSADAIAPAIGNAPGQSVGQTILDAVLATQRTVGRNTNLGIVLLIAPLAAVPHAQTLRDGIAPVLRQLTQSDASLVYRAIRAAQPGGMGNVEDQDLADEPTGTLVDVMRLAAERDAIARQYANDFDDILTFGLPTLYELAGERAFDARWEEVVIGLQLRWMAMYPDTLIARKRGRREAEESAGMAAAVLDAGLFATDEGRRRLKRFDEWLRAEGNARNPGTTADLVTACLFAALREGVISDGPFDVKTSS